MKSKFFFNVTATATHEATKKAEAAAKKAVKAALKAVAVENVKISVQ